MLGQSAHHQACRQTQCHSGMLGAGAAAGFRKAQQRGGSHQQYQQRGHQRREEDALRPGQTVAAMEGVAPVEKEHTHQNAAHETSQAEEGVPVTAGQAQDHPEGAA